jgi:hypothetical protein
VCDDVVLIVETESMRLQLSLLAITLMAVSGCDQISSVIGNPGNSKPQVPQIDNNFEVNLSSPDNALKTWWRYIDAKAASEQKLCTDFYKDINLKGGFEKVSTGEVSESLVSNKINCTRSTYAREILEVKVETETRAVALAKITNSTATTVAPTIDDEKRRAQGEKYKYVIEKVGNEWRIAQAYEYTTYKSEWTPKYQVSKDYYPAYVYDPQ